MQYAYFVFRSVTHGQKAKAAADRLGIGARLQRSPRALSESGCAYALTVRQSQMERLAAALHREDALISGIYLKRPDGSFERVRL